MQRDRQRAEGTWHVMEEHRAKGPIHQMPPSVEEHRVVYRATDGGAIPGCTVGYIRWQLGPLAG